MYLPTFRGEVASAGNRESVKGRLKPGIEFWSNTLDASDFVLRAIREGYRIPFYFIHTEIFASNFAV